MKQLKLKKLITKTVVFIFAFLTFMFPLSIKVSAATDIIIASVDIGYDYDDYFTKDGTSCKTTDFSNGTCHNNGICVDNTDSRCNCLRYWPSADNYEVDLMGTQCLGFARFCQWKLYGTHDRLNSSKFTDVTGVISASDTTASNIKSKLLNVSAGTHIRTGDNGHSMVVVSTTDTNIQIASCNNGTECILLSYTYTWEGFATYLAGRSGIKYAYEYAEPIISQNPDDYPVPTRLLKVTSPLMSGSDVSWVQAVLFQLGYDIEIDGYYGNNTAAAIKLFQGDNGLSVDGQCGPLTRAKLTELWEELKNPQTPCEKNGHTEEVRNYVKPTKESEGYTGDTYCSVCGELLSEGEVISKMPLTGDINSDGDINLNDVSLLAQYVAKWNIKVDETALDTSGDGSVNLTDVSLLAQYVAKWNVILN